MNNTVIYTSFFLLLFLFGGCKLDNLHDASEVPAGPDCLTLVADFALNNNSCAWPCSINFENRSVNGVNYFWEFGDGNTASLSDPEHAYAKPGTYNVQLTVSDENGCEKTIRKDAVIGFQTFEKVLGVEGAKETGEQLIACANGGFAIIGSKNEYGVNGSEGYIIRLDEDGTEIWSQTYGGPGDQFAYSGIETPDEGFVFVGEAQNPDTTDNRKAYFQRVFDNGNPWFDNFYEDVSRNPSPDFIYTSKFSSLIQASNGKYVMLGTSNGFFMFGGGGSSNLFLAQKTDRSYDFQGTIYSQSDFDEGREVIETADRSSYLLLGSTQLPSEVESDPYLIKVDTSGQLIWDKVLVNVTAVLPTSIIETEDRGFIVLGNKNSGSSNSDIAVLKLDASGNLSWEKTFGRSANESASKVIQTEEGDLVIVGTTASLGAGGSDLYLLKLTKTGDFVWEKTFGGALDEWGSDVLQATDGGFLLIGGKDERFLSIGGDILFIKTDEQGNVN